MASRIDFEKSIASGTLRWKRDSWGLLMIAYNYFWWALFLLFLLWFPLTSAIGDIQSGTFGGIAPAFYIGSISFGLLALSGILFMNKMVRGVGMDTETNRAILKRIVEQSYPGQNADTTGIRIVRVKRVNHGSILPRECLTILFDENRIHINILTTLRKDVDSPFHGFHNYFKARSIVKEFEKEINKKRLSKSSA